MSFEKFCRTRLAADANAMNTDSRLLLQRLREVLRQPSLSPTASGLPLSNLDLETVFSVSVALGFALWQHLAGFERLLHTPDWATRNEELIKRFAKGELLCGLATTHLRRAGGPGLRGHRVTAGYLVNGTAPWVCGFGLFDMLIIGFDASDEIGFALIDYPRSGDTKVTVEPLQLSTLNGTSTARLHFEAFAVHENELINRRKKTELSRRYRSEYQIPELGMAKFALDGATDSLTKRPSEPLAKALTAVRARIAALEIERDNVDTKVDLDFEMASVVRASIRLWALSLGGSALQAGSALSRLQLDVLLLDAVIQDDATIALKAQELSRR